MSSFFLPRTSRKHGFSSEAAVSYLVFCVGLEEKDVDDGQLVRESVSLKLLSDPRPQGRDG